MNVVGRVGSLISQGVYSVATPFHPFGGAVDIIVVQQQDGTFRSTPWYVRFGKFQGVLKGAEKIVHISVNGDESIFHMYLDNSGEAYFIKEVETGQGSQVDGVIDNEDDTKNIIVTGRLEHSVSDSGVVQMRDGDNSLVVERIERSESDIDRRFYDFQDEQSSMEDSVVLSESGSNRYENLENESCAESQGTDSEVILVSVDGHVLTAPILASEEQNTEDVQLSTPQFHLGPGEGTDFVEDNEFTGENAWAADYISQLNTSTDNATSDKVRGLRKESSTRALGLKVFEGGVKHDSEAEEALCTEDRKEDDLLVHSDSEDVRIVIEGEIFKSCLELSELAKMVGNADSEDAISLLEPQFLEENSKNIVPLVSETKDGSVVESRDKNGVHCSGSDSSDVSLTPELLVKAGPTEENVFAEEQAASDKNCVASDNGRLNNDQFDILDGDVRDTSSQGHVADDEFSGRKSEESPADAFHGRIQSHSTGFEISLCGNELQAGMGLLAAAEAFDTHRISAEEFEKSASSIIKNENLIIRFGERYMSWVKAAPIVLGMAAFGIDLEVDPKDTIPVEQDDSLTPRADESGITATPSGRRWRLWPIPFRRVKTLDHSNSNSSNEEVFVDSESTLQNSQTEQSPKNGIESSKRQLVRTNVPTTEQIASLNLKEGKNMIAFTFSTRVLGTQKVDAHIYLWKWNARIVISDVDGTITKSDVLGQFMPLVGKDWTQSGVARLFTAIKENGYQLLFLSARAIVQAYLTRSFLLNLKQDGKALPNGPVVISPDGLFPSLFREVIRRAPHEFKIACLEDIKKLFPPDYNPFYAGFGNRDTDELSYRKVGIPKGKIFIINPKGEVAISHRIDVKSYTSLHTLVNDMFPPTSLVEQEDYNSWNFWKMPMPEIE